MAYVGFRQATPPEHQPWLGRCWNRPSESRSPNWMLQKRDSCIAAIRVMICALRLPPALRVVVRIAWTLATWAVVSVEALDPPVA